MPQSVLIVRLGALGDLVHALPAAAALRQAWPDARMDKAEAARNPKGVADKLKERNEKLAAFRTQADFPARLKAVDAYIAAYDEYAKMRRSVSDTEELKRMLRGSGDLAHHGARSDAAVQRYIQNKSRAAAHCFVHARNVEIGDP